MILNGHSDLDRKRILLPTLSLGQPSSYFYPPKYGTLGIRTKASFFTCHLLLQFGNGQGNSVKGPVHIYIPFLQIPVLFCLA